MIALCRDGGRVQLLENRADPQPADGEAIVRVHVASITGLDLAAGGAGSFEGVLGHSFVGHVESMRGGRRELNGARVVPASIIACGRCDRCASGLTAHCRERTIPGVLGRDGGLAERVRLPIASLVPVPNEVDDDAAAFAVPVAAAIQAARQLTIQGKPFVTVLGDGRLGLLVGQVMSRLNASVRVVGRHPEKLALCERWALKQRHIDEVGRRADQDVVVDCTGTIDGLVTALRMVRPRGTVMVKSLHAGAGAVDQLPAEALEMLVTNEITMVGSGAGPVTEAIATLRRREIDVISLISRRAALRDRAAVLRMAADPLALGVLVTC